METFSRFAAASSAKGAIDRQCDLLLQGDSADPYGGTGQRSNRFVIAPVFELELALD